MSYEDIQPLELNSLPTFMRSTTPQVKFHSAFPPLTTTRRVKSVMERAGFDVYKPPEASLHPKSNKSSPNLKGSRNFTAPHQLGEKPRFNSDPQFQNKRFFSSSNHSSTNTLPIDVKLHKLDLNKNEFNHSTPNLKIGGSEHTLSSSNHGSSVNLLPAFGTDPLPRSNNFDKDSVSKTPIIPDISIKSVSSGDMPVEVLSSTQLPRVNGPRKMKDYGNAVPSQVLAQREIQQPELPQTSLTPAVDSSASVSAASSSMSLSRKELHHQSTSSNTSFQFHNNSSSNPYLATKDQPVIPLLPDIQQEREQTPEQQVHHHQDTGKSANPIFSFNESSPMPVLPSPKLPELPQMNGDHNKRPLIPQLPDASVLATPTSIDEDESFQDAISDIDAFDSRFEVNDNDAVSTSNFKSPEQIIEEREQEVEDSLLQLLSMKKELSPAPVMDRDNSGSISSQLQIPSISNRANDEYGNPRDDTVSSIYNTPDVKRLSTMHTDDFRIYNTPDDRPTSASNSNSNNVPDMTTIEEDTEIEDTYIANGGIPKSSSVNSGSYSGPVLPGLTRIKLNTLNSPNSRSIGGDSSRSFSGAPSSPSISSYNHHKHSGSTTSNKSAIGESYSEPQIPLLQEAPASPARAIKGNTSTDNMPPLPLSNQQDEIKYSPGEGPCRSCSLPIKPTQKSIWSKDNQLTGQWHRKCFSCFKCSTPFSKGQSCYVFNDLPFCAVHFHEANGSLCSKCGNGIEGQCLENEVNELFHRDCLVCNHCGDQVVGEYYVYQGKVVCEKDAAKVKQTLQNDDAVDDKVTRRYTRIMYL